MEKSMIEILSVTKNLSDVTPTSKVKKEIEVVNGVDILKIPSRDAYSYALQLMDILFSKEELASSLIFKSKKSTNYISQL